MRSLVITTLVYAATFFGSSVYAQQPTASSPAEPPAPSPYGAPITIEETEKAPASAQELKLSVASFRDGDMIPNKYAFCVPTAQGHTKAGPNISPSISWSEGPAGTKSYAVILYDADWPKEQREKMNKEGEMLTSAVPRQTIYHWVLVDIPAGIRSIPEGAEAEGRVPDGIPPTRIGVRGISDFTRIFAANEQLKGADYGYKGPCPPWNDDNIHHMHFKVYALNVPTLKLGARFDGAAAMDAMRGKILAQGELLGVYTQNPAKGAKFEQ
jgi:Raf kinase inhibitor-like YbhB/YbcL family protein